MNRSDEVRAAQKAYNADIEGPHKDFLLELERIVTSVENGVCPHCNQPMTQKQAGKCVYAEPCGHRLWQGRIKKVKQVKSGEDIE